MKLAALLTTTLALATIIGLLWRIAWTIGRFTQRLDDHMAASDKIHTDQETRLRQLERPVTRRRT